MPQSYGIHPVLNIAHLERYQPSPAKFGNRLTKSLNRVDFNELPEYEVEMIIADQRKRSRKGRYCCEYTDIFPFSSLIIYSLNYFPDIFTIYLFKPYYLEVTDIFLHFSH